MKNIYDIRKEKCLQFILSTKQSTYTYKNEKLKKIAIVVNLYYKEKVKLYGQYLNNLPVGITLYIFSSKEETLEESKRYIHYKNTHFIKKENRGRDVSAFLVAFIPYINNYELICFLHDKRENEPWLKPDIDKWNENLWTNMIATSEYIGNILELFDDRTEMGMLFPPEPIGEYKTAWFFASWSENFNHCLELARKMHLSADIRLDKPPIALGSVFWARKEVLSKLLGMNWRYEDFPDEPMPSDFTISHAIERVFGYIAQDAGYEVGTVMTEQYASWLLLFVQDYFRKMFSELSNRMGIDNLKQFDIFSVQKERILNYVKKHKTVFLYGAGKYGKALLKLLREERLEPAGFLVTNKKQDIIESLKVYEISDVDLKENGTGIILTVYYHLQEEMIDKLKEHGVSDFLILFRK